MTMEFPLSQSPRTQGFQVPQSPEDEKDLFTKSFSDLAYRAFQKAQPELMTDVLTFRVLDVDAEEGRGIGTFILQHGQDIVFVPCVVSDNAVKPLDLFYSRTNDRFYPFKTPWLRESAKGNVNQLGNGVRAPKTMPTDVDIRNLVTPPTSGRFTYAADTQDAAWLPFIVALRKEKIAEQSHGPKFLEMMSQAPDGLKVAFVRVLERRPKLAKMFGEFYGADPIMTALRRRPKLAEMKTESPSSREVSVMDKSTPVSQIKRDLKPGEASRAFQQIRTHGFYVHDPRSSTDSLFSFAEKDLALTRPTAPGLYNVYLAKGDIEKAVIIPKPLSVHRQHNEEERFGHGYYRDDRNRGPRPRFLVLLSGGRFALVDDMVAEPILEHSHAEVEAYIKSITKTAPGNGERGVLISAADLDLKATEPMNAAKVSSGEAQVVFEAAYHHTVIMNRKMKGNGVLYPQGQDTLMVADSFRWFVCKTSLTNSEILTSPSHIFRLVEHKLAQRGGTRVEVKKSGPDFVVGGDGKAVAANKAVEKIANRYNLRVKEASEVITLVGAGIPVSLWRVKRAAGESLDPNAPAPPPQPEADPNAPPPPPSGLDLATGEKLQQIAGQIAALQQMQQILTEVQQRAQMIDQGGGPMAAPAAAAGMAAGPGTMGGQAPMVPAPMGGAPPPPQGVDPAQGQASPQGAPQGAPPGPPPGPPQDPSQAGGGVVPMGAPPGPPQPMPPPPVMAEDEPSPQNLEQQVNPAFLQDAAGLQDAGIFDATAIASMAKQKGVRELVQNYTPTIEKAMDNLGRMLLLFYMKEGEIKEQIGAEAYEETEQKIRDVFRGLGDALLALGQYAEQMQPMGA